MSIESVQWLQAAAAVLCYLVLCGLCLRSRRGASGHRMTATLVAYASQGGVAESLARRHADHLGGQGPVTVLPLNSVAPEDLQSASLALFFASTYGEGEPPDNALRFARRQLPHTTGTGDEGPLADLHFAVLALGDRDYRHFCRFGLELERGLQALGAKRMFAAVTVDRESESDLADWDARLRASGILDGEAPVLGVPAPVDWSECVLAERRHLNPGSPGGEVYHLRCTPPAGLRWSAGDIAVVAIPTGSGVVEREYSLASLPEDGAIDLVLRQVRKDCGSFGVGSGWLTRGIAPGDGVTLRLRSNPAFHPPLPEQPMVLVGNGTGIAGLRAHLRARLLAGAHANWLVFGERTHASDRLFDEELVEWGRTGHLERIDRVYSRDGAGPRYVQDLLEIERERLCAWLDRGAAVYVCGSLEGMAPALHRLLLGLLGEQGLESLTLEGRYRRDIY